MSAPHPLRGGEAEGWGGVIRVADVLPHPCLPPSQAPQLLRYQRAIAPQKGGEFLPITRASLPVLARQYSNPRVDVLEYLHVGTGVPPQVDYRDTVPKVSFIPVILRDKTKLIAHFFVRKRKTTNFAGENITYTN